MKEEKFKIIQFIRELLVKIDKELDNFPKKDIEIKNRIRNNSFDLLEIAYAANTTSNEKRKKELLENAKNNKIEDIFKNKRVVFTGEMTKSRVEMRVVAIQYGAVTTTNVSAKTDILVVGYEPGVTKIKKAKFER